MIRMEPGPALTDSRELRRRYVENLRALYRAEPELATRVDASPFGATPNTIVGDDGGVAVQGRADDGCDIWLASRRRPRTEAEQFVEALPDVSHPAFFLLGLGSGEYLDALTRRCERPSLIVIEPDIARIKLTLALRDCAEALQARRLVFLWDADVERNNKKLGFFNADLMLGARFVAPPHSQRVNGAFQQELRRQIADFISTARVQVLTLLQTSRTTFENVLFNFADYLRAAGVETLAGKAKGFPAVIVAAGPSLSRHFDLLREARSKAVVIAVQTVFKLLRSLKIDPHFVTTLDYHEVSRSFFEGVTDVGGCEMVAEPKAAWRTLEAFAGRKRVLSHRFHTALLRDANPKRASLPAGSTVAHLAFYLAQHLGCDPIIFVGQDLAFSEGLYYMPGAPIEQVWAPELCRFTTLEMRQWERIARNRPILRKVEDVHGKPVYTDDLLFTYAKQFESSFATATQRVIQASEAGAKLRGAEVIPFGDALAAHAKALLPVGLFDDAGVGKSHRAFDAAITALTERVEEVRDTRKIARRTHELLTRLTTLIDRPAEFNRIIVEVDELRARMLKMNHIYSLVVDVSAAAELRRYGADRRLGEPEEETPEVARRRLARDADFVGCFLDGCDFLEKSILAAIERLRERGA